MDVTAKEGRSPAERRADLLRSVYVLRAKAICRGYVFSCFLDEAPWELIPRWARDNLASRALGNPLVVNPTFRYAPAGDPPGELLGRLVPLNGLLPGLPLAWIHDPGTTMWAPFWARGEWADVLQSLHPGQPAPPVLQPPVRQTLAMANILVPPGHEQEHRAAWETTYREAAAHFKAHNYVVVRDLIHPVHVAAMRHYYRALLASGRLLQGDRQVADRQRLHSEPVAMFFHAQLTVLVSRIAGEPVKPSYVYFASYPPGSSLPRHVDRDQCEFSISFLVDYTPEPDGPSRWPLFLENPDVPGSLTAVDLRLGEAVLYRGRQLAHYRDRLPDGHRSSSLFFHYVRPDYVGDTV
jgi:hypothetical protein